MPAGRSFDVSCKLTYALKDRYYINITLENARQLFMQEESIVQVGKPQNFVAVTIDVNDRYAANQGLDYNSDKEAFDEVLKITADIIDGRLEGLIKRESSSMWRNSTGTISLMTSTLFLTVSVATSSTVLTKDIFRYEDAAAYQSYISTRQNNSAFGEMNNTDSANAAVPEDLKKSLTKISLIASLQDNWNGNGALAYSAALIEKSRALF